MKKAIVLITLFFIICPQLFGCATMSFGEKGAITGTAVGSLIGAAIGGRNGAVIGAIVGTVFGSVIGHYYDKQVASRAEAARNYNYSFRREMMQIENSSLTPEYVPSGSKLEVNVMYTFLSPQRNKQVKITETRVLDLGSEKIVLDRREVLRAQGTHISTLRFTTPRDLQRGNYIVTTIVSTNNETRMISIPFKVV